MKNDYLKLFFAGYVGCAEWVLEGTYDGFPDDMPKEPPQLTDEDLEGMRQDCQQFVKENACDLRIAATLHGLDAEHAGHDFYLTRNRHGAGFWDRGLGHIGDRLTGTAQAFGNDDRGFC